MALINRVQIVNMIRNKRVEKGWKPRFVNEVYNLGGYSSIVQMPNGVGKTTISNAFNALLSRRGKLIKEVRKSLAPASHGCFSHFRVEFVPNSDHPLLRSGGIVVGGQRYVFGFYGTQSKSSMEFYYYQGTLEDLPVCETDEKGNTTLYSQKRFNDILTNFRNINTNMKVRDWRRHVSQAVPRHIVERMSRFQEAGGGENQEAGIFQVKTVKGEKFDETFFWEVLAPELMANPMGTYSDEDEYHFEDTILRSVSGIVAAQIEADKETARLKDMREALVRLDGLVESGNKVLASRKILQKHLTKLSEAMASVKYVVEDSGLPGFPRFTPSGDKDVDALILHLVIDPDQGILLMDRGLAGLLGKDTGNVNQQIANGSIKKKSSQAIEIISNQKYHNRDRRGRESTFYNLEGVFAILDSYSESSLPASVDSLKEVVKRSFEHFKRYIDTNPFRVLMHRLGGERAALVETKAKDELKEQDLAREIERLEQGLREFKENQGLYEDMVRSGLFSKEELDSPLETQKELKTQQSNTRKELKGHSKKRREWSVVHALYLEFLTLLGEDADPTEIKKQWDETRLELGKRKTEVDNALAGAKGGVAAANKELEEAEEAERPLLTAFDKLSEKSNSADPYYAKYPDKDPVGLEAKVRKQLEQVKQDIATKDIDVERNKAKVSHLRSWKKNNPGKTPSEIIKTFLEDRQLLASEKLEIETSLQAVVKDIDYLSNRKIAPDQAATEAFEIASNIGVVTPLHEVIQTFSLEKKRQEEVLSLFSSLLFAPVVEDMKYAAMILSKFEDSRITMPVFVRNELLAFCGKDEIIYAETDGIVHTYLAGRRSFTVECIIEPDKLEKAKTLAEQKRDRLKETIEQLGNKLDSMGDDHPVLKSARKAQEAEHANVEENAIQLNDEIRKLTQTKQSIEDKYPESILLAARFAELFVAGGGKKALHLAKETLNLAQNRIQKAKENIKDAQAKNDKALESLNDLRNQEVSFAQKTAGFHGKLDNIIVHLERGGVDFMKTAECKEQEIQDKLAALAEKLGHNFERAAAYLSSIDSSEEKRRTFIAQKQLEHVNCKNAVEKYGREIGALAGRIGNLRSACTSYDHHIAKTLPSYRALATLMHDEEMQKLVGEAGAALVPPKDLITTSEMVLDKANDVEVHAQDILSLIGEVSRYFDEELNLMRYDERARSERNSLQSASTAYGKAITSFTATPPKGVTLEQARHIGGLKDNPGKLKKYVEGKRTDIERDEVACERARQLEDDLFQKQTDQLMRLAESSFTSLDIMRHVLRKRKGATYEIEVERNMKLASVLEKLVGKVKRAQIALNTEHDLGFDDDAPEARHARKSTLQNLRHELYRSVFLKPKIRIDFPHICGPKKKRYSNDFSAGERMALSLLWLSALAEYSMSLEEISDGNVTSSRKRTEFGPSIFWIDGIFSHLSDSEMLKATLELQQTLGKFQLIGLMHNPASLLQHDFKSFPKLFVTMLRNTRANASPREWAESREFNVGEADSILAFLDGSEEREVTQ